MKSRRHHNNKGSRQIKRGKTADQVKRMAKKLKVPFVVKPEADPNEGGMTDYEVRSLSGELTSVPDDVLATIVMSVQKWRECSDMDGARMIGIENAVAIRDALRAAGFVIVRKTPEAE